MPSHRPVAEDPTARARERASILAEWGRRREVREAFHRGLLPKLPTPTARPDFRLARAIAERHAQLAPTETLPPPRRGTSGSLAQWLRAADRDTSWAFGQSLAMRDALWGWSPACVKLRERAMEEEDPAAIPALARSMARHPEAPWRRWACASKLPWQLHEALDALGHMEPPIALLGAASLPCLMGFSGLPILSWAGLVCSRSEPGSFISPSGSGGSIHSLGSLLPEHPDAFPDLPCRAGHHPSFSRVVDVTDCAERAPAYTLLQDALGFEDPTRETRDPRLPPFADDPFLLLSSHCRASGLPEGFDHPWPMARTLSWRAHHGWALAEALAAKGCRVDDIHMGLRLWEHAAMPESEQGSEGYYAPLDERGYRALYSAGADFTRTRLADWWSRSRGKRGRPDMPLSKFYKEVLQPWRAQPAAAAAAPWEAACRARSQAEALGSALPDPGRRNPRSSSL